MSWSCIPAVVGVAGEPCRGVISWRCGIRSGSCPRSSWTSSSTDRYRWECPCCHESTCAVLPKGVPSGQSGPRLTAFVGRLRTAGGLLRSEQTPHGVVSRNNPGAAVQHWTGGQAAERRDGRTPRRLRRIVWATSFAGGPQHRRDAHLKRGRRSRGCGRSSRRVSRFIASVQRVRPPC